MEDVLKLDEAKVEKVVGAITAVCGGWVAVSPLVLSYPPGASATVMNFAVGVFVAVTAWARSTGRLRDITFALLGVAAGAWLTAAPWAMSYGTDKVSPTNDVLFGAFIAILSFWSALAESNHRRVEVH